MGYHQLTDMRERLAKPLMRIHLFSTAYSSSGSQWKQRIPNSLSSTYILRDPEMFKGQRGFVIAPACLESAPTRLNVPSKPPEGGMWKKSWSDAYLNYLPQLFLLGISATHRFVLYFYPEMQISNKTAWVNKKKICSFNMTVISYTALFHVISALRHFLCSPRCKLNKRVFLAKLAEPLEQDGPWYFCCSRF